MDEIRLTLDFTTATEVQMSISRQRNSNSVPKRVFQKVLILIIFIGLPVLLFLFTFGIKKAEVVGENRYTSGQIREMVLKNRLDYNSVYLYLKYRFFHTPDLPFIEKLDIEMNSNHKVTIHVYEKMVTGCVNIMGEYLYFDKDGIIVESSTRKIEKVPIIEGLKFNEIVLHQKLNLLNDVKLKEKDGEQKSEWDTAEKEELFYIILNITKSIQKYDLNVDRVEFDENKNVTLSCKGVKVLLGKKIDYEEALADMKIILKEARDKQLYILDMRNYNHDTGYVIGKTKNSTE